MKKNGIMQPDNATNGMLKDSMLYRKKVETAEREEEYLMPNYKKLSDSYTDKRSEKSCQYALNLFSKPNYKNIKYILINKETESQEK